MTVTKKETEEGGPLAGVRVLDLTINVLGPLATQTLGDMGADVIKIEPPGGDPMRQIGPAPVPGMGSHFLGLNRNKRSVVLDLKQPSGRRAMARLIAGADVLVHNMRHAAARRLGIDHESTQALNPRLIHAAATGYREDGPDVDRPAYDDVIQAESGLVSLMIKANGEARYVPMALADKLCGLVLASAVGMALFRRERSGRGEQVHVPMLETMLAFNLTDHLWHAASGAPEEGVGFPRMFSPHRRPYATADGRIAMLANTDAQWQRLFEAIEQPELGRDTRFATLSARMNHIDDLNAIVAAAMAQHSTADWRRRLDAADLPNGEVRDFETVFDDPYLKETEFFERHRHPEAGLLVSPGIPVSFSESPPKVRHLPPQLGADTQAVLREAGLSAEEIVALQPPSAA